MNKTITLNNNVEMPLMGYGIWQIAPAECEQYVSEALKAGYRSIDTAQAYYNEEDVGEAVSKSGIPRKEIFLTTKIWISNAGEEKAARSIARAIGLSNFYDARFVDLAENMEVKPAVVQLETHVFSQQVKMRELMKEYGTRLMAWSPLARGMNNLFGNEMLKEIADRHGKDIAQICLKFLTDEGIIVIPQSTKPERIRSNFALDDFELTDDEQKAIRRLDAGHPFAADFNDPALAKYLLGYDKQSQLRRFHKLNDVIDFLAMRNLFADSD